MMKSIFSNLFTKWRKSVEEFVPVPPRKSAMIEANHLLVSLRTTSGYSMFLADYKGKEYILPPDVDNETLGKALTDCLAHSRYVFPYFDKDVEKLEGIEFDPDLFNLVQAEERGKAFIKRLMKFAGCKTKSKLYKPMYGVGVEQIDGIITLRPSTQEAGGWSGGIPKSDYVKIPDDSSAAEMGAAIRLAISKCKSRYDA